MPQVFGAEDLSIIKDASLWVEAATERDIEKATHPSVAAEARARGLVPLRIGNDPIWTHPETGEMVTLTPAHTGDFQGRTIQNNISMLKRKFPTEEEKAYAARSPEQIAADSAAAANATRTKKQEAVEAAKRKREREQAAAFKKAHEPFRNMSEIQQAFDKQQRGPKPRPGETVEQFAEKLRNAPSDMRQQVHRLVFPERYS